MKNSLVSVILPTYNRKNYIEKAVKSVFDQTYQNIELIIIDDCSNDRTDVLIEKIARVNPKVVALHNEQNLGLAQTLNRGISSSKGVYIARLDDDDFWCDRNKVEKQVDFLEKNKEYGLIGGGVIKIDKTGKEIMRCILPTKDEDIRRTILLSNPFAHASVLFRKDIFEKVGGYDNQFDGFEDWDLWLKIGKLSKFYNFPEFLVCLMNQANYHLSYLDKRYKKIEQLKINLALKRKYRRDYPDFKKAIFLCWVGFLYSLLPFKYSLRSLIYKVKNSI